LQFSPKTGDKVICLGKTTVFEKSGNYQLNVMKMFLSGVGELQLKFEELKEKLSQEGLFDEIHKRPLPAYPEKIGVITSSTGAAIKDIKNVISRRFPCRIFLYPATVQGDKAAREMIAGINFFNQEFPVDLLIVGRGGGSQEDLFCFNDEALARAIFNSKIPVISAVGHEIDFTIADWVSDLRAPTPSAAAELAVPNSDDLLKMIKSRTDRLKSISLNNLYSYKIQTGELENRLTKYHPINQIRAHQQRIDEAGMRLEHLLSNNINRNRNRIETLSGQLKELSPYNALQRGYSILRKNRIILNSVEKIKVEENVNVLVSDGSLDCKVTRINPNEK
jgi:exodeoxyribonuclease VII large subunit